MRASLEAEHGRKPTIVVDDAGVGGGVVDRLNEQREFRVVAFLGAEASRSRDYPSRRDESWFRFAEVLPQLDLPDDEELAADLLAPRYSLDSQGRRAVEAKSETKRRLRRSPDRGDSVVMAFSVDRRHQPARWSSALLRRRGVTSSAPSAAVAARRVPPGPLGLTRGPDGAWTTEARDPFGAPAYSRADIEQSSSRHPRPPVSSRQAPLVYLAVAPRSVPAGSWAAAPRW